MSQYFEEIEILEGVYLKDKETLIQRDWSSFFDIIFFTGDNEIIYESKKDKFFIDKLLNSLNFKFKSLQKYFDLYNQKEHFLNNRIYNLKEEDKEEDKKNNENNKTTKDKIYDFSKEFLSIYLSNIKKDDYPSITNIDDIFKKENFKIKKVFNSKSFFSDHESLLDKNNDFLKNKKVFLGLKNDKKEKLNTFEDQINNLKEEQKFYVKVKLNDLKINDIIFEGYKKYENIFILERGDYIYHTKEKQNG